MKKGLSLAVLVLLLFLFGCSKETILQIKEINGYQDAVIDTENMAISLMVDNDIENFTISDIVVENNISVTVYSDANYSIKLDDTITLKEGLNVYYLRLSLSNNEDIKSDYTLNITRRINTKYVVDIEIIELKKEYQFNEDFKDGLLLVKYNDNTTKTITLTIDMVSNFKTNKVGNRTLSIKYEDKEIQYDIDILVPPYDVNDLNSLSYYTPYVMRLFGWGLLIFVVAGLLFCLVGDGIASFTTKTKINNILFWGLVTAVWGSFLLSGIFLSGNMYLRYYQAILTGDNPKIYIWSIVLILGIFITILTNFIVRVSEKINYKKVIGKIILALSFMIILVGLIGMLTCM